MSAYVRPMLAYVCPRLGLCWAYVGPKLAYVGPMLSHLGGYVGHMLGICWLSWAYVEDMLGNVSRLEGLYPQNCLRFFPVRPAKHYRHHPVKNTAFFDIFPS